MTITLTQMGYVVLPATLLLLLLRPRWLLGWTLFVSVFQAAAVFVVRIGGRYPIGLQPGFFVAPIAILVWLLSRRPERWFNRQLLRTCAPLYLFTAFAVGSAVVLPKLFQGILVESPREGVGAIHLLPLHLSLTNLSGALYLLCCVLLFHITVQESAADPDGAVGRRLIGWALAGICAAALVGLYEVAASRFGFVYPHRFFNSNSAYAQLFADQVAGQARLTGTFTEASVAAWFFGAATAYCLWRVLFARRRGWYLAALGISGIALLLTEASTAYLIAAGIALLVPLRLIWLRRLTVRTAATLMAAAALLVAGAAWALRDAAHVRRLLNDILFRKARTLSYFERAFSNRVAWHTFLATRGLGAGWGSLRASSLAATLLANVGLVGFALALWFALRLIRREWRVCSLAQMRFPHREGLIAALAAMLISGFVSVTDVTVYLPFWAFAGVYVAALWNAERAQAVVPTAHGRARLRVAAAGFARHGSVGAR